MCGRYSLTRATNEVVQRFQIAEVLTSIETRYNIAPSDMVPIICNEIISQSDEKYVRTLRSAKWGLVPFWAKTPRKHKSIINARAESLVEKTSFRYSLQKKRCLVPVSGFYEWKKGMAINTPMYIKLENNETFAFAGLWDDWRTPDGEVIRTFTIITVPANDKVSEIHNRMPAILDRSLEDRWLDPNAEVEELLELLKPSHENLETYRVSQSVNSPNNDNPECIQPAATNTDNNLNSSLSTGEIKPSRKKKPINSDAVQLELNFFD